MRREKDLFKNDFMLVDKIKADLVLAMKAKDEVKTLTLRSLLSAINYQKIDIQRELTDEDIGTVIAREVKKHRESIEMYEKGNRADLVDKEKAELAILLTYMPKQMTEVEVEDVVKVKSEELTLLRLKATEGQEAKNIKISAGELMKAVMPILKGKADGKLVKELVDKLISNG